VYGLLGPNGAGKTSTLEMLEGMNDIDGGSAIIDGLDVGQNSYEVKKIIGVQLQANEYFDRLNLIELLTLFGKLYSQEIDPIKLLQAVTLADKANAKPEELSGGQKQRIGIARALYHKSSVLVFDEATSALDTETETEIMSEISNLKGDQTIIVIAHRLSTLKHCDRILELSKGSIVNTYQGIEMQKLVK